MSEIRTPGLSPEMRSFYLHREVSLSLTEAALAYVQGERPTFAQLVDWVAHRRGVDEELDERRAVILAHLSHNLDDVEAWYATAAPIVVAVGIANAAARAGNFSADQAQQHAINLETPK